jgi:hypothetical protein
MEAKEGRAIVKSVFSLSDLNKDDMENLASYIYDALDKKTDDFMIFKLTKILEAFSEHLLTLSKQQVIASMQADGITRKQIPGAIIELRERKSWDYSHENAKLLELKQSVKDQEKYLQQTNKAKQVTTVYPVITIV